MPVSLAKSPTLVIARNSWTREIVRASLTSATSVPISDPRSVWTFHLVPAGTHALSRPYSPRANAALQLAETFLP